MPDEAPKTNFYGRYWDYYVNRWAGRHNPEGQYEWPGDEWGSEAGWEGLYQQLFVPSGVADWKRVVEIGQGSGKYTLKVLQGSSAQVRVYDASTEFLNVCKIRCEEWIERGRLSLHHLTSTRPNQLASDLIQCGWRREVDALYSIDAMVHVDLQYLIVYLITAGVVLRPGGHLILTLADATRAPGFQKLLTDIAWTYPAQDRPQGSGKFEWLSPDIVRSVLPRLGFELELLIDTQRDLRVVASLKSPGQSDDLRRYIELHEVTNNPRDENLRSAASSSIDTTGATGRATVG